VNVDRREWGAWERAGIWLAGLGLLAAAYFVLVAGSRSWPGEASRYQTPSPASALTALQDSTADAGAQFRARNIFSGLPLMFEPNQGQAGLDPADSRAKFVARGSGYSLFLGSEGAILNLETPGGEESLQMKLSGASPNVILAGADQLPGHSNYIIGNDPAKWRRGIPQFARVRYADVYPGISLVFYGNQGKLEYDFRVAPGSDPAQAELTFGGAQRLEVKNGALVIHGANRHGADRHAAGRDVRFEAPRVYQEVAGRQEPVEGRFVLRGGHRVGFALGNYDRTRELVIDPLLNFSTYFGGSGDELSTSVAVDSSSNIYITGSTNSSGLLAEYPSSLPNVYQPALNATSGARNVYIAKITPPLGQTAAVVDYVTYLGGSGADTPAGIAVDNGGNAYVAGSTTSCNFPTSASAYQNSPETCAANVQHVFVSELSTPTTTQAQSLIYSSYLSGSGTDIASGMTIDANGYIYVTGTTTSVETSATDQFPASNLPQALPYQNASKLPTQAQFFVTKVNTNAPKTGSIAYSTYFGGANFTPLSGTTSPTVVGGSIAVDVNGNVYFTGTTNFTYTGCAGCQTTDFPILDAYQPCLNQAPPTTIINPATCSVTTSAFSDAFVAKLNPNAVQGSQLLWSTYLGGSETDTGTGIALDAGAANIYVTGTTNSQIFTPTTTFASFQRCLNNLPPTPASGVVTCTTQTDPAPSDAYVARLSNPTGATTTTLTNVSLTYFSYLGGSNNENGLAIAVDAASGALLTGWTESPTSGANPPNPGDFPTVDCGDIQCSLTGSRDAFMARVNTAAATGANSTASWATYFGSSGITEGTSVAIDVNQTTYVAGDSNATGLRLNEPLNPGGNYNGGSDAFVTQLGTAASLQLTGVLTLGTNQTYIAAGSQATFSYTLINNGPDLASGITVTDDISQLVTGIPLTFFYAGTTSGTCSGSSTSSTITCSIPSLQAGLTVTITIVVIPTPATNANGGQATFNGGNVKAVAANNITPVSTSVSAQMSDYSLSVSPSNVTLQAAGEVATYQVQLTPHPVFGTNIALSVSGAPTGATPTFTTTPVSLQGTSPGTSTLRIATTARPITTPAASLFTRHFYATWFLISGLVPGLALLGVGRDRRRRRIAGVVLLCFVFALLVLQPACSGTTTQTPVSGTPPGTYNLILTATAGNDSKTAPIILTVP